MSLLSWAIHRNLLGLQSLCGPSACRCCRTLLSESVLLCVDCKDIDFTPPQCGNIVDDIEIGRLHRLDGNRHRLGDGRLRHDRRMAKCWFSHRFPSHSRYWTQPSPSGSYTLCERSGLRSCTIEQLEFVYDDLGPASPQAVLQQQRGIWRRFHPDQQQPVHFRLLQYQSWLLAYGGDDAA